MSEQVPNKHWIPLLKYAAKKGVSLSTLRRHIKADKIRHKKEKGKYFIFDNLPNASSEEVKSMRVDLQRAYREIAELKTLIAFYEEQRPNG